MYHLSPTTKLTRRNRRVAIPLFHYEGIHFKEFILLNKEKNKVSELILNKEKKKSYKYLEDMGFLLQPFSIQYPNKRVW
jgi:hypothetical protein